MRVRYEHTQAGTLIFIIVAVSAFFLIGLGVTTPEEPIWYWLIVGGVLVLIPVLFGSQHVRVTDEAVELKFGVGLIRRRFPLAQVRGVYAARDPWYWGWGVRWTPKGRLYRISGLDCVALELDGGSRQVRIGTDDPTGLTRAIKDALPEIHSDA